MSSKKEKERKKEKKEIFSEGSEESEQSSSSESSSDFESSSEEELSSEGEGIEIKDLELSSKSESSSERGSENIEVSSERGSENIEVSSEYSPYAKEPSFSETTFSSLEESSSERQQGDYNPAGPKIFLTRTKRREIETFIDYIHDALTQEGAKVTKGTKVTKVTKKKIKFCTKQVKKSMHEMGKPIDLHTICSEIWEHYKSKQEK